MRERNVDLVARAAPLDERAVRLGQLVLAERDRDRPDHRRRNHRDAGERLLGLDPGSQILLEDLGIDPAVECSLARFDRVRVVFARPFPEFHERDDNLRRMPTEQVVEEKTDDRSAFAGVLRFYELAKKQEWQVRDLPWGEIPPIPEGKGTRSERLAARTCGARC